MVFKSPTWLIWPMQNDAKKWIETQANGYSSESTSRERSNEYQHDRLKMVFKSFVAYLANTKWCKKLNQNPGKWVLIWEYFARVIQWIPTWQGLNGFQSLSWLIWPIENYAKNLIETQANGYSSESTSRKRSNEYQQDRVWMIFKSFHFCVLYESSLSIGGVKDRHTSETGIDVS